MTAVMDRSRVEALDRFSVWLWEQRLNRGWTQQELANRMDSHQSTIANWEIGYALPSLRLALRLARTLGMPVDRLTAEAGLTGWVDGQEDL